MAKKSRKPPQSKDKGTEAIKRGPERQCEACFGWGVKRKADNKGFEYLKTDDGVKATIPCPRCLGTGKLSQLPQEDFAALVEQRIEEAPLRHVTVHKRRDNVQWLYDEAFIDKRLYEAGRSFKRDFERGHFGTIRATNWLAAGGGGGAGDRIPAGIDQRDDILEAFRRLGTRLTMVAWELIGMETPIKKVAEEKNEQRSLLIRALRKIADVYRPQEKC